MEHTPSQPTPLPITNTVEAPRTAPCPEQLVEKCGPPCDEHDSVAAFDKSMLQARSRTRSKTCRKRPAGMEPLGKTKKRKTTEMQVASANTPPTGSANFTTYYKGRKVNVQIKQQAYRVFLNSDSNVDAKVRWGSDRKAAWKEVVKMVEASIRNAH